MIKHQEGCILPSLRFWGWANPAYNEILPRLCELVPSLMNLTFLVHEKVQVTDRLTTALKDLVRQSTRHTTYHLGVTGSKACPLLLPPQACGSSTLDHCSKSLWLLHLPPHWLSIDSSFREIPCCIDILAQAWETGLHRCPMGCQQAFNTGTTSIPTAAPSGHTWPLCLGDNRDATLGQSGISVTSPL